MENSLRMVLSSRLIEESLSLDLPFFTRLSTVLDQMGLQAVKQGQITENWQKQAPWLLIEDNQSLCCGRGSPLASVWELLCSIRDRADSAAGTFPIPEMLLPCIIKQSPPTLFLFFKLDGSTLSNTQPNTLTLNKVSLDLSVFRMGRNPRFSLQQTDAGVSHWFKFKNMTAGKYKQMKRSIYSGKRCCFFWRDRATAVG